MTFRESIKENAFVIMMITGGMQFIFTVLITLLLNRNAKRQLRLDVLRSIDSQWQELNKLLATNPQLLAAIGDKTMKGASEAEIIRIN
ncbi:MAG: hypothetical protein ACKVPJ_07065 [Chitinophagales bacterium]